MENLLKIVEQFLSQSDEKLEELSQKNHYGYRKKRKKRMRKFLVILLLPIFLKSVQVVSTENPVILPNQEVYSLTHASYHFYYQDVIESPKFYGETPVYSTEDLIKESGKVNAETKLSVLE